MESIATWDKRWQAMEASLEGLCNIYATYLHLPGMTTLHRLTRRLKFFGKDHFDFFLDNMLRTPRLKGADPAAADFCGYAAGFALSAILAQVGFDMDLIRTAAEQRLLGPAETKTLLAKADRLARLALQPAVEKGWLKGDPTKLEGEPFVVSYVQKKNMVRVIPYANVMLVGVPATCAIAERDFLATAHEAGHYVYWHGRMTDNTFLATHIQQAVQAAQGDPERRQPEQSLVARWVEEMFADIYGAAIGGPVMGADFQDIADREAKKDFLRDDQDHPAPAVRPGIYAEILRQRHGADDANAANLDATWNTRRAGRQVDAASTIGLEEEGTVTAVPLAQTEAAVKEATLAIWNAIQPVSTTWLPDVTDQPLAGEVSTWYGTFEQQVEGLGAGVEGKLTLLGDEELKMLWEEWVKGEKFFGGNLPHPTDPIDPGTPAHPQNGWLPMLIARGWTIGGPNNQWKPPG